MGAEVQQVRHHGQGPALGPAPPKQNKAQKNLIPEATAPPSEMKSSSYFPLLGDFKKEPLLAVYTSAHQ